METTLPLYEDGIQPPEIDKMVEEISFGLIKRIEKHKSNKAFVSTHEIYGKTMEEMNEFMDEVRANDDKRAYDELMDVVCAGIWGLLSMKHWEAEMHA